MMDWSGVLESSHRALSINGSTKTKYQCFSNRFNSVGGLESATQRQTDARVSDFQKRDAVATITSSSSSLTV